MQLRHVWVGALAAAVLCFAGANVARCEFLIAVAGPVSGVHAAETAATKKGAERAAQTLNAKGGIAGWHISVVAADDGCMATTAEVIARYLVQRHADLVLGHPCEAAALAASAIYGASGTLFFATLTRHPSLTAKRAGPSIFRLSGRDDAQGKEAAHFLVDQARGRPVAIVHDRTRYARRIAAAAAQTLKGLNVTPKIVAIDAGEKDYSRDAQGMRDAGAVFFAGFPLEAGLMLRALRALGSDAVFIGTDSIATAEFTETFEADAQGVVALRPKTLPASEAAQTAIELVAAALTNDSANTDRAKAVQDAVDQTSAPVFDANGDDTRVPSFEFVAWSGAEWLRAEPLGAEVLRAEPLRGGTQQRQPSR